MGECDQAISLMGLKAVGAWPSRACAFSNLAHFFIWMGSCAKMKNVLLGLIKSSGLHSASSLTPPLLLPRKSHSKKTQNPLHPLGGIDQLTERQQNWRWANMFGLSFSLPSKAFHHPAETADSKAPFSHFATIRKGLRSGPFFSQWHSGPGGGKTQG